MAVDRSTPPDVSRWDVPALISGGAVALALGLAATGIAQFLDTDSPVRSLLVAVAIAPAVRDYCVFCHRSAEPGHLAQLRALDAEPLLDLGLRLGEGTGAALAWPLVRAAASFLSEMASFASAGVSERL